MLRIKGQTEEAQSLGLWDSDHMQLRPWQSYSKPRLFMATFFDLEQWYIFMHDSTYCL